MIWWVPRSKSLNITCSAAFSDCHFHHLHKQTAIQVIWKEGGGEEEERLDLSHFFAFLCRVIISFTTVPLLIFFSGAFAVREKGRGFLGLGSSWSWNGWPGNPLKKSQRKGGFLFLFLLFISVDLCFCLLSWVFGFLGVSHYRRYVGFYAFFQLFFLFLLLDLSFMIGFILWDFPIMGEGRWVILWFL